MFDEAFASAEDAVAAEKALEYRRAFDGYSRAVRLFLRDLPRLPDEGARRFVRDRCAKLMVKAEKAFLFASNTHNTGAGLEKRLELLDGPRADPADFERRFEALYGPTPVMGVLAAERYERMQRALQGDFGGDGSDAGGGGGSGGDDGDSDTAAILRGSIAEVHADMAAQLDHLRVDEQEGPGSGPRVTAADYVADLLAEARDAGAFFTAAGGGSPGVHGNGVGVGGDGDDDEDPDHVSAASVAAVIEEAKFSMLIPEAPTGRPTRWESAAGGGGGGGGGEVAAAAAGGGEGGDSPGGGGGGDGGDGNGRSSAAPQSPSSAAAEEDLLRMVLQRGNGARGGGSTGGNSSDSEDLTSSASSEEADSSDSDDEWKRHPGCAASRRVQQRVAKAQGRLNRQLTKKKKQ